MYGERERAGLLLASIVRGPLGGTGVTPFYLMPEVYQRAEPLSTRGFNNNDQFSATSLPNRAGASQCVRLKLPAESSEYVGSAKKLAARVAGQSRQSPETRRQRTTSRRGVGNLLSLFASATHPGVRESRCPKGALGATIPPIQSHRDFI